MLVWTAKDMPFGTWNPLTAPSVSRRMKRLALPLLVLCLASAAFAEEPEKTNEKPAPPLGARADKLIKEALPTCSEAATESRVALQHALPADMVGAVVRIASKH